MKKADEGFSAATILFLAFAAVYMIYGYHRGSLPAPLMSVIKFVLARLPSMHGAGLGGRNL